MRLSSWLLLLLAGGTCSAWDTKPHQAITKAALDSLPRPIVTRLGSETAPLIEIYCLYPDRYLEMSRYGFVRSGAGPKTAAEIKRYCERPDGEYVHGAGGDRESDTRSLVFLLERIVLHLREHRPADAARYAGVLSHFVADSLSPPHSVSASELLQITPESAQSMGLNIHAIMERSIPEFTLSPREPHQAGAQILPAAREILDQCYEGQRRNRADLPAMAAAASKQNEQVLDGYRSRAGRRAAEILADALFTLFRLELTR